MADLRLRRAPDRPPGRRRHDGPRRARLRSHSWSSLMLVPAAHVAPTVMSLVAVDTAKAVDFEDGVVVGPRAGLRRADPRPARRQRRRHRADRARPRDRRAARPSAIPRDTWSTWTATSRRRSTPRSWRADPNLMATEVEQLTGVTPQYVLTTGFEGFEALVDKIGGVTVRLRHRVRGPGERPRGREGAQRRWTARRRPFARSRDAAGQRLHAGGQPATAAPGDPRRAAPARG